MTVYHYGEHTCPVVKNVEKNVERVEQLVENNPNIKPSEIQSACVLSAFRKQLDWSEVEREVESTLDRSWISNIKKKVKREMQPVGHDFEAVAVFKEYCDKKDVYYIYKMNDRRGNPDKPSFVFKSSKTKAEMALNMDKDGNHFLNEEFCYFDGKHKRCKGLITLTASVYHPLLRKQVALATMETESENTETITLFWTLFNEVLQKVSRNTLKKFNPLGWCTDMAGANMAGIINVFGEDGKQRIKSCEFHFKDHRNKMSKKQDSDSAETFQSICNSLLIALRHFNLFVTRFVILEHFEIFLHKAEQENKDLIVTGDLNCNLLLAEGNIQTKKLKDLMQIYQLRQHITTPTRITTDTQSLIDIILTKVDDTKTCNSGVVHVGISDHSLVYICRKIGILKKSPKLVETRQFKHFNALRFQNDLSKAFSAFSNFNDVNKAWETWKEIFLDIANQHAPLRLRRVKSEYSPWMNNEIKKLSHHRDYLKKKAVRLKSSYYFEAYKQCKNQLNRCIKETKKLYYNSKLAASTNSKESWRTINELLNRQSKATTINEVNVNGKSIAGDKDIAN